MHYARYQCFNLNASVPKQSIESNDFCHLGKHQLILSSFVVDELKDIVTRKFPRKSAIIDKLLTQMSYELIYIPITMETGLFEIRDMKDYHVLYSAITDDTDVLITGDKDFSDIEIEKPEILTPNEFMEKYL